MAAEIQSFQEFYEIYKDEAINNESELSDWNEGSINDILAGAAASLAQEIASRNFDLFKKTFIGSAEGDDLEALAVDHFGESFARPEATKATGIVTFERPNALAGDCEIPAGTVVKTAPDANGNTISFETLSDVTMTGTSVNASVETVEAGTAGNVDADEITVIESSLTDPTITVNNDDEMSGGEEELDDPEYRDYIYNLITQIPGAIQSAIEAKALTVPGIEMATAYEEIMYVKEWDIANDVDVGDYFKIVKPILYVADANGEANDALIELVRAAIATVQAFGVYIVIESAVAVEIDWTVNITLNPSGPNYGTLQTDMTMIVDTMISYIQSLGIGDDFVRSDAEDAIMALWGPSGTDDITAISTETPLGDIDIDTNEKAIPGDVGTA